MKRRVTSVNWSMSDCPRIIELAACEGWDKRMLSPGQVRWGEVEWRSGREQWKGRKVRRKNVLSWFFFATSKCPVGVQDNEAREGRMGQQSACRHGILMEVAAAEGQDVGRVEFCEHALAVACVNHKQ